MPPDLIFLLPSGARVLDAGTNQAGTALLVRTVRRGGVCVSPELFGGDEAATILYARELTKRGYLPTKSPMTRAEFDAATVNPVTGSPSTGRNKEALWEVVGLGVPLGLAMQRAGVGKGSRRLLQRWLKTMGWTTRDEP